MMRVAIVGGGAAGVLAAVHLRRGIPDAQITLIDASGRPGTGAAYGTDDSTHLLNVPAPRMSAWPDDPDHFCRWLDERAVTPDESFAPRLAYGRYLQDQLLRRRRANRDRRGRRIDARRSRAHCAQRRTMICPPTPSCSRPGARKVACPTRWNAPSLRCWLRGTDGRVVLDPWAPGALAALGARRPAEVLVIGSGLTGVDVALHLIARGATVTLLSRHGALPRRFRATGAPTELPNLDALAGEVSLEQLRAALAADLAHARENGVRLATSDRRGAAAHGPAVAVAGMGGPAPVPARGPAAVGGASPPDAAHDCRRDLCRDRQRSLGDRGG